jgi:integrase
MPTAFAIIEAVQWVASTGGSVRVSATTRSAISDPSGGIRETIPRQRAKSDREHVVPLANDALEILATLPHFSGGDYVFSMSDGRAPINGLSKYVAKLDAGMLLTLKAAARARGEEHGAVTLPNFVLHDLRRCVRTGLARQRIPEHVAELVLGHARRGLPGVYDQHSYAAEIREALETWAARVRALITPAPDNVLAFQAKS